MMIFNYSTRKFSFEVHAVCPGLFFFHPASRDLKQEKSKERENESVLEGMLFVLRFFSFSLVF
jgi:hypothetical protein